MINKEKKLRLGITLIVLISLIGFGFVLAGTFNNWEIEGDMVWFEDDNVFISATPHTLTGSGWVIFNFTSKIYEGNIDAVLGFDSNLNQPTKIERYNPTNETREVSYICDTEFFDYTTNPKYAWCYQNITSLNNETGLNDSYLEVIFEHSFESGNLEEQTINWTEDYIDEWKETSLNFNSINYNYGGMNKWYYTQGTPINKNQGYVFRVFIKNLQPFKQEKNKYWFAIKPSSETISEAINKGHFYALDPWTDSLSVDLVGYYALNYTTGDVLDSTGKFPGTNVGATRGVTGKLDNAFDFETTQDDIVTLDDIDTEMNGEISITWWAKYETVSIYRMWSLRWSNQDPFMSVQNLDANSISWIIDAGATRDTVSVDKASGNFVAETWYFFAVVRNATHHTLFLNDDAVGFVSIAANPTWTTTQNFRIGARSNYYSSNFWDGEIDEFAIWNRSLTASEVMDIYNSGTGITYLPPSEGDTTPPTFSNAQTNTTLAGATINFSILVNDETALHPNGQYIFSTNNSAGSWTNESAVNFTETPEWANVTMTLNSTSELIIGYQWYANDTESNLGGSGIYTLTTTDAPPTISLVSPADNSLKPLSLNFTYLPKDDIGFTKSELYINITDETKYGEGILIASNISTEMNYLYHIEYVDINDTDSIPDLFFSYQEFASKACLNYYKSDSSNSTGFKAGIGIYCMDEGSFARGIFGFRVRDINNDSLVDLIIGNDADWVSIMYGNTSRDPPFNIPLNMSTATGNEGDFVVPGHSSDQTLMDIFNAGEEVCAAGTCLYQFKANASEEDGYNDYIELGGVSGSPDNAGLIGGFFNGDDMIDLVMVHKDSVAVKHRILSLWLSNDTDPDKYNDPIEIANVSDIEAELASVASSISTDETENSVDINGDGIADIIVSAYNKTGLWGAVYLLLSNSSEDDFFNEKLLMGNITLIGTSGQSTVLTHGRTIDINDDGVLDYYATNFNIDTSNSKVWLWYGNSSEADYFDDGISLDVTLTAKTGGVVIGDVFDINRWDMLGVRHQNIGGGGSFSDFVYLYKGQGWKSVAENSTIITNNTNNNISYTFASGGTYLWNVLITDSTDKSAFASANRTVEIVTIQDYDRNIILSFTLNQVISKISNFFRDTIDNLSINEITNKISNFLRNMLDNFGLNNIVSKLSEFFRSVVDNFGITNITKRVSESLQTIYSDVVTMFAGTVENTVSRIVSFLRGLPDVIGLTNLTNKISDFFRDMLDNFGITDITSRLAEFFRSVVDSLGITDLTDTLKQFIRNIVDNFGLNNLTTKLSEFFRNAVDNFGISDVTNRLVEFFRTVIDNFSLTNLTERLREVTRDIVDNFSLTNLTTKFSNFFRSLTDNFGLNNLTTKLSEFTRAIVDNFGLNNITDSLKKFIRNIVDNFGISDVTNRIGSFFRNALDNFGITTLTTKLSEFTRSITDNFGLTNITDSLKKFIRGVTDNFGLNDVTNRVGGFFRNILDNFGLENITNKLSEFFRTVIDNFSLTHLTDRLREVTVNIVDNFGINALTERLADFFRTLTDNFNFNSTIDRVRQVTVDIVDNFGLTAITDTLKNFIRGILDTIGITNLTERLTDMKRTTTQPFSITAILDKLGLGSFFRNAVDNFGITALTQKMMETIRTISQEFTLNNLGIRVGDFFRDIVDNFGITALTERVGSFFRNAVDNFGINALTERLMDMIRNIIQTFQMFFTTGAIGTFDAWAWTNSVETLTQMDAYEELRVPWDFYDKWTSHPTSPHNWINTTKTYSLPTDCANVLIKIGGVDRTVSVLVNNTDCDYTVINNNTMTPGSLSNITINYTTTATTSAEGDVNWWATNRRLGNQTHWANTLTLSNPSIHDYVDIATNITGDANALTTFINITNSTPTKFTHTFNNINGNINWSLPELDSLDDYLFYGYYRTDNITINKTNHTQVISGKDYDIWKITIEANSTRPILNVYSYFNFSDEGVVANRLYKCSSRLINCTEDITNKLINSVVLEDKDLDGDADFIYWFVNNLTQNQSYQLHNDRGFPIEVAVSKRILNKPIYVFDNILWEVTITMYNPNAFATQKIYKYEFPLGSADIELDDIRKNLAYDPFGSLAPFVTIIDKDDPVHTNSVFLAPIETKIFTLTYRTESVTLDISTYFPSHFDVDSNALISQFLRIKNQAEDDVEDIEYRLKIDYGKNLIVCEGRWEKGCPDDKNSPEYRNVTLDSQSSIKGDYTLEIEELVSGETMLVTISYKVPTAKVVSIENGRRAISGNLTTYRLVTIESQARFTMGDIRYKDSEIPCENIQEIDKCRVNGICDIPLAYSCNPLEVKLNTLGMGEEVKFYIWYLDIDPDDTESWLSWLWNWGTHYTIGAPWKWILGLFTTTDAKTGEVYITTSRIILLSIAGLLSIPLTFLLFKKRKIRRRNKNEI